MCIELTRENYPRTYTLLKEKGEPEAVDIWEVFEKQLGDGVPS